MRPPRETYARGYASEAGFDCTVGIEIRPGDDVEVWTEAARSLALHGAKIASHRDTPRSIESIIRMIYGGDTRAYFIETEHNGGGVQVFQPFGVPRNR